MSCRRIIFVIFDLALFSAKIYGSTTAFSLPRPNNFDADIGQLCVELTWEEPDSSTNNLLGYYLYRTDRGKLFYFDELPVMPYEDYMVIPFDYYSYYVTAFYEEGESAPSITDSSFADAPSGSYYETFNTDWHLTGWHQDPPDGNWMWMIGCAYLSWSPAVLNYDMSLISPGFYFGSGIWYFWGIYAYMYINDYSTDTGEKMEIWIMHDDEEDMIFQWDLDEQDDWGVSGGTEFEYLDLMQYENEVLQLKFRSHGGNTYNFNYWYIYGIEFMMGIGRGIMQGYVLNDDGEPIEEARIHADVGDPSLYYFNVLTDTSGFYHINPMLREYYNVRFYAPGYSTVFLNNVRIQNDSTTCHSVVLGVPTMSITPSEINDSIQIETTDSTLITIENNGTGALEWESYFDNFNPPNDTTWIALSDSFGIVPSEDIENIYVIFNAIDDSVCGTYSCKMIFKSYPDVGTILIPVNLITTGYSVEDLPEENCNVISPYPNPFHSSTNFSFSSQEPVQKAEIKIYNIKGQLIKTISFPSASWRIGTLQATWDGRDENGNSVLQGVYLYRMSISKQEITGKVIKLD